MLPLFPVALVGTILGHGRSMQPIRVASTPRLATSLAASAPCESAAWPQVQAVLDQTPVFTVANSDNQPLQYQVGDRQLAVFYVNVEAGKQSYETARDQHPDLGYDLITVGLGQAFKLASEAKAMVVPGSADLQAAGAPEGAEPMGQEVPLFACMDLKQRDGDDGAPQVPLFFSYADSAAAVAQANDADQKDLQIDAIFSLQSIVEELAALEDPSSGEFVFEAPSASLHHAASYLGQGIYVRKVEDDEEEAQ